MRFAQGYADAWAKRDSASIAREYIRGFDEGTEDRRRADAPVRRRPGTVRK